MKCVLFCPEDEFSFEKNGTGPVLAVSLHETAGLICMPNNPWSEVWIDDGPDPISGKRVLIAARNLQKKTVLRRIYIVYNIKRACIKWR